MLEVRNISFSYGTRCVLDAITFDLAPGEILAVVGTNGAGKTTLLKVLATLLMQDAGEVTLDAINPLSRPLAYRRKLGYLSERCPLHEEMTVEAYLKYRLRLKGERQIRLRRRIDEVIASCGLSDLRQSVIGVLSQGCRKRVGLAEAMSAHPGLLMLDDPWAGLDRPSRRQIAAALTSASGRAAVMIAGHEISEMLDWCTRVLVLYRGRRVGAHRVSDYDKPDLLKRIEQEMTGCELQEVAP